MTGWLPTELADSIKRHLRTTSRIAEEGWESAEQDEDTLTGDFCGALRTGWQSDVPGWRWKVTYKKYSGRGKGATEKRIGADGIFEIQLEDPQTGERESKGLLFQAKKRGNAKGLKKQIEKMKKAAPNASSVFEYGADGYYGYDATEIDLSEVGRSLTKARTDSARLGDFLADQFVPCNIGTRGLYYDAVRRRVIRPDPNKGLVATKLARTHSVKIQATRK